jgi:hypothetical protein
MNYVLEKPHLLHSQTQGLNKQQELFLIPKSVMASLTSSPAFKP